MKLGKFNYDAMEDVQYLIDRLLDDILVFPCGALLAWFQNGFSGFTDIRLVYKTRTLRIWLVNKTTVVDLEQIKNEASDLVAKLCE